MKAEAQSRARQERDRPNLDVEKYSREVVINYNHRAGLTNPAEAKLSTINSAATHAEITANVNGTRGSRIASAAIDTYTAKVEGGAPHDKAIKETGREMAQRFDSQGMTRDRKQVRQQEPEISF